MGELRLRQHRAPLKVSGFYPGQGTGSLSNVPEDGLFSFADTKGLGSEIGQTQQKGNRVDSPEQLPDVGSSAKTGNP
jgi:hypothetical protein